MPVSNLDDRISSHMASKYGFKTLPHPSVGQSNEVQENPESDDPETDDPPASVGHAVGHAEQSAGHAGDPLPADEPPPLDEVSVARTRPRRAESVRRQIIV